MELTPKAQVLEGRGIRGILKFRVSEMAFPGVFKRCFPSRMPMMLFRQNTHKIENNAVEMSQAFHDIA